MYDAVTLPILQVFLIELSSICVYHPLLFLSYNNNVLIYTLLQDEYD